MRALYTVAFFALVSLFALNRLEAQTEPIVVGIESGTNFAIWQHATPNYFSTVYPYPPGADTVQIPFHSGAKSLFGFYTALSGNFYLNSTWSVLAKFSYSEWRGEWNSTEPVDYIDSTGATGTIPIQSDLVFMLRSVALEAYMEYHVNGIHSLYLGAGAAVRGFASGHYDLDRTITGGPAGLSFVDFSTGRGTGNRSYSIGGEQPITTAIADLKLLAGYSIALTDRWSIDPELAFDVPLMGIWTSSKQSEYEASRFGNAPEPLALTGILSLEYQAQ